MEGKLKVALSNGGINEDTMEILQEMVRSVDIFVVLKEEHFQKLLPKLRLDSMPNCSKSGKTTW